MSGIEVRLRDIFQDDHLSVVADITQGLYGINDTNNREILKSLKENLPDAIIGSPGLVRQNSNFFLKKKSPSIIIRADWSNYKLNETTNYPSLKFRHVKICNPTEAIRLGASALVCDVFFGIDDINTANDIHRLQKFVVEGHNIGLPIIANIILTGSRINERNFTEVLGLGIRTCAEIGADIVILPLNEEKEILKVLRGVPKTEILIYASKTANPEDLKVLLAEIPNRYKGIILDGYSSETNWEGILQKIHSAP